MTSFFTGVEQGVPTLPQNIPYTRHTAILIVEPQSLSPFWRQAVGSVFGDAFYPCVWDVSREEGVWIETRTGDDNAYISGLDSIFRYGRASHTWKYSALAEVHSGR